MALRNMRVSDKQMWKHLETSWHNSNYVTKDFSDNCFFTAAPAKRRQYLTWSVKILLISSQGSVNRKMNQWICLPIRHWSPIPPKAKGRLLIGWAPHCTEGFASSPGHHLSPSLPSNVSCQTELEKNHRRSVTISTSNNLTSSGQTPLKWRFGQKLDNK